MTAQDVISRGADIDVPDAFWHSFLVLTMAIMLTWAIGLILTIHLSNFTERRTKSLVVIRLINTFGFLSIILTTWLLIEIRNSNINEYLDDVAEWKVESAYPYIESLEPIELELTSIEKNTDTRSSQPDEIIKYRNANQIIETLGPIETTWYDDTRGRRIYQLIYDVPKDDTPFVRFHTLKKDLGHGVDAGAYPLTVHLNEQ